MEDNDPAVEAEAMAVVCDATPLSRWLSPSCLLSEPLPFAVFCAVAVLSCLLTRLFKMFHYVSSVSHIESDVQRLKGVHCMANSEFTAWLTSKFPQSNMQYVCALFLDYFYCKQSISSWYRIKQINLGVENHYFWPLRLLGPWTHLSWTHEPFKIMKIWTLRTCASIMDILFSRPSCITENAWKTQLQTTPWIFCIDGKIGCKVCRDTPLIDLQKNRGMRKAEKWTSGEIAAAGTTNINRASFIRTKINVHQDSDTHKTLMKVGEDRAAVQLPRMFGAEFEKHIRSTSKIFRAAYYIANEEKPFTDHPKLINLQEANGNKMGILLQSRITEGSICEFIGRECKRSLLERSWKRML